jgi:RNA polymerase sigma-70 factor (ECF subfamily)
VAPRFPGKVFPALPLYSGAKPSEAAVDHDQDAGSLVRAQAPALRRPSFEEIYRTYFDEVCRWTRILGGPEAEREDLVQDVFVVVHRRLDEFDGQNVPGWLYQITRRRVRDFRRLRWFRVLLQRTQVEDVVASPAPGPEAALGQQQETEKLAAFLGHLLSRLPESQRVAFSLFEIEGYSGEEIAKLQNVPINTVWARIHKARVKLAASAARLRRREGL